MYLFIHFIHRNKIYISVKWNNFECEQNEYMYKKKKIEKEKQMKKKRII